ncbi:MAG: phosphatidate cytidylyltransferase [Bacteroidota bacterium]
MTKFTDLYRRLLSALAGAAIIVSSLLIGEWSYFIIFLLISIFSQWEFYRLVKLRSYLPIRLLGVILGTIVFCFSFFIEKNHLDSRYYYAIFPLASLVFLIKLYKKNDTTPFINIALFYLGITYVAIPFALMNVVVFYHGYYSYQIMLGLMMIIWSSDTGAYFAGIRFGKTKLFERISPKKSWEGALGGAIVALLMAYGMSHFYKDLLLWQWLCVAMIVVIAGTYGDLVESLFKRSMEIKDSGSIIPGHGGFLDRFDSLILSVPFIVVFLKLF